MKVCANYPTIVNVTHYVFSLKKQVQKDEDLKGMKSHDFHVMIQDILPLCM
jgi:hypothetical protein